MRISMYGTRNRAEGGTVAVGGGANTKHKHKTQNWPNLCVIHKITSAGRRVFFFLVRTTVGMCTGSSNPTYRYQVGVHSCVITLFGLHDIIVSS